MKKSVIIIIILLFAASASGYLYYDWQYKDRTKYTDIYSWHDESGNIYYSDKPPSTGVTFTQERKIESIDPALVIQIKDGIAENYTSIKQRVNSHFDERRKRRSELQQVEAKKEMKPTIINLPDTSSGPSNKSHKKIHSQQGKKRYTKSVKKSSTRKVGKRGKT